MDKDIAVDRSFSKSVHKRRWKFFNILDVRGEKQRVGISFRGRTFSRTLKALCLVFSFVVRGRVGNKRQRCGR